MLDKKPRTRVATLNARVGRWHETRSYKRSTRADSNTWYESMTWIFQAKKRENLSRIGTVLTYCIISGMHQLHVHKQVKFSF